MTASIKQYVNLDFQKTNQLLNARAHNVTTAERIALAASLTADNLGLHVLDIDLGQTFYWVNPGKWDNGIKKIEGAMVYQNAITDLEVAPLNPEKGFVYMYNGEPGELIWPDQTFLPSAVVEKQDLVIYAGEDKWDVVQGNSEKATEILAGKVKLATTELTNLGVNDTDAVTPKKLKGYADHTKIARVFYSDTVDLVAGTPFEVEHGLALQNKDAYTVNVNDSTGQEVSVVCNSVDINKISLTSNIAVTGLKVTVIGF
jgi:hypothetical protein